MLSMKGSGYFPRANLRLSARRAQDDGAVAASTPPQLRSHLAPACRGVRPGVRPGHSGLSWPSDFRLVRFECDWNRTTPGVHASHLTYDRIFHELPSDVVWLCKKCHDELDERRTTVRTELGLRYTTLVHGPGQGRSRLDRRLI